MSLNVNEMSERRLGSLRDFIAELRRLVDATGIAAPSSHVSTPTYVDPPWIDALLCSPQYQLQRERNARLALPDERMRACLRALAERGGRITRAAFT